MTKTELNPDKAKPPVRVGRKAAGLSDDKTAELLKERSL